MACHSPVALNKNHRRALSLFSPHLITHAIAATRQLFQAATHLGFGLGVYRQKALALVDVE